MLGEQRIEWSVEGNGIQCRTDVLLVSILLLLCNAMHPKFEKEKEKKKERGEIGICRRHD